MLELFKRWLSQYTQHSELERYISSKHPQNAADVEHYEREFNTKLSQGRLL
jgi:hypothetical protein